MSTDSSVPEPPLDHSDHHDNPSQPVTGKRIRDDDGYSNDQDPSLKPSMHHTAQASSPHTSPPIKRQATGQCRRKIYLPMEELSHIHFNNLITTSASLLHNHSNIKISFIGKHVTSIFPNGIDSDDDIHILVSCEEEGEESDVSKIVTILQDVIYESKVNEGNEYSASMPQPSSTASHHYPFSNPSFQPQFAASQQYVAPPLSSYGTGIPPVAAPGMEIIELQIGVPSVAVGYIIGKSGQSIKDMQASSGATIQVEQLKPGQDETADRIVHIKGTTPQNDLARMMIRDKIKEILSRNALPMAGTGGVSYPSATLTSANSVTGSSSGPVLMKIPNDMVGLIIGKRGESIQLVEARSGAKIQMQKDSETPPGATERDLYINGTAEQIEAAKSFINGVIQECITRRENGEEDGTGIGFQALTANPGYSGSSENISKIVWIVDHAAGLIIGRGGETIKSISMQTGAKIQVAKAADPQNGMRAVTCFGTESACQAAELMIHNKVEHAVPQGGRGAGMPPAAASFGRYNPASSQQPMGRGYPMAGGYGGGGGWNNQPPPSTQPPPRSSVWSEHMTPEGIPYFYNSQTQESVWERPRDM